MKLLSTLVRIAFFILLSSRVSAQLTTLSGRLRYINNQAVAGATVYVALESTSGSVITDSNGAFRLGVFKNVYPPGARIILIVKIKELNQLTNREETYDYEIEETVPASYAFDRSIMIDKRQSRKIVFGTVMNRDHEALAGIKIFLKSDNLDARSLSEETDQSGYFRFSIPKSIVLSEFEHAGIQTVDLSGKYRSFSNIVDVRGTVSVTLEKDSRNASHLEYSVPGLTRVTLERIRQGDKVRISTDGSIRVGQFVGNSTPEGKTSGVLGLSLEQYNIVPSFPHGALMYRFATDNKWRLCGRGFDFVSASNGPLDIIFQVNDNDQANNSGSYTVRVLVEER